MKVFEERTMNDCLGGHEYPIGSGDILCRHEIDWENTSEVAKR